MFCHNCGSSLPDNARFCGKCGAAVSASAQPDNSAVQTGSQPAQSSGESQAYGVQTNSQQPYGQAQTYAPQQPYGQAQTYASQPSYGQAQTYAPQQSYGRAQTNTSAKSGANNGLPWILLIAGGVMAIVGFFLPLIKISYSSYSISVSMMDMSFGTGSFAGAFDAKWLPLMLFLIGGILALIFGLTKSKVSWIATVTVAIALVYMFAITSTGTTSSFDMLTRYGGVGFWLSSVGAIVTIIGGIMGSTAKR